MKKFWILPLMWIWIGYTAASASDANVSAPSCASSSVLEYAQRFIGISYGFGQKNGHKIDCSGFTQKVYARFGILLPRSASGQAKLGNRIRLNELKEGDLLFFRTYKSSPSHVGIYAGNGRILHASYAAGKVQYDSITKGYYKNRFLVARRFDLANSKEQP